MISQEVIVGIPGGLHLRPATILAEKMRGFSSDITLIYENKRLSAKSIIEIIASGIKAGAKILVQCEGADQEEALAIFLQLVTNEDGQFTIDWN